MIVEEQYEYNDLFCILFVKKSVYKNKLIIAFMSPFIAYFRLRKREENRLIVRNAIFSTNLNL